METGGYKVYLGECLLPIPPEKIQVKINNANDTITLMNEGQINLLKQAKLTDIEFECIIPQIKYPFASYSSGFQKAEYFFDFLEDLKMNKKVFPFIVNRALPNGSALIYTDIKVSMENYTITEQASEGFDFLVKVKLKQYIDYGTKLVKIEEEENEATVQETRAAGNSPAPTTTKPYTVKKGDCLWKIAKYFYGDGAKYTIIYNTNKETIGGNPNRIKPGQVLMIPAI